QTSIRILSVQSSVHRSKSTLTDGISAMLLCVRWGIPLWTPPDGVDLLMFAGCSDSGRQPNWGAGSVSEPEVLYRQIGRLIETAPDFSGLGDLNAEQLRWLGRARALVVASNDPAQNIEFDFAAKVMQSARRGDAAQTIMRVLYNALASAELKAPP